jgi:hypothetical protein
MGQRQVEADSHQPFKHSMVYALPNEPDGKYGRPRARRCFVRRVSSYFERRTRLARDLHRKFKVDPPERHNGPFEKPTELPMKNALGITPREAAHCENVSAVRQLPHSHSSRV